MVRTNDAGIDDSGPLVLTSRVMVFSDVNCPFCFTLNEWLNEMGLADRIKWVGIEHKPGLPFRGENDSADREILTSEVAEVARRAPDVGVQLPSLWVNSRRALIVQCAVEADYPELAPQLRTVLFRRLWLEGRNIATDEVIEECLEALGLPPSGAMFLDEQQLDKQTAWWRTELDHIPSMVAPTNARHLGLQDRETVRAFILSALFEPPPGPGCQ